MEQEPNHIEVEIKPIDYSDCWVEIYEKPPWWKFWGKEKLIISSEVEAEKPPFDIVVVPVKPETKEEREERMWNAICDFINSRPD